MIKTITYNEQGTNPQLVTYPIIDRYINWALVDAAKSNKDIHDYKDLEILLKGYTPDIILDDYTSHRVSLVFIISNRRIIKWGFINNDNLITRTRLWEHRIKDMSDILSLPLWDNVDEAINN